MINIVKCRQQWRVIKEKGAPINSAPHKPDYLNILIQSLQTLISSPRTLVVLHDFVSPHKSHSTLPHAANVKVIASTRTATRIFFTITPPFHGH